ncbi:MAG: response regulator [Paracoccaceae bacterium]
MKFLAVDDDPVFLDLIVNMLRRYGYEDVVTAASGQEAVKLAANASVHFDCFLVDIQMPGMDGVELVRALRCRPIYQRTPIVMVTSMSDKTFVDDAFTAGATDYIIKPLEELEFKARLGMVARLHDERARATALVRQNRNAAGELDTHIDFDAPRHIPGVANVVEYLALENYLLTIGNKGVFGHAAFGIHIENAAHIFARTKPSDFVEVLGDVASVIFDGLKAEKVLLAYVGSGDFVALSLRQAEIDLDELEVELNIGLSEFESVYSGDRLPVPRVRVGGFARSSLFTLAKPTRLIGQAVSKVRPRQARKSLIRAISA